ncbi:hypothetical protein Vi05172_g13197 [Venturia inaequalis]|nr:hypothetical protein Vi05172_g13197 [Venturia inaequalis]
MILSFTAVLPIIVSLLTTQLMAQNYYFGPVDKYTTTASKGGICPPSPNNKNLYFCGPSGASIEIKPAQPKADIIVHAGSIDANIIVTYEGA